MAAFKKENLIEGWKIVLKYLRPHKRAVFVLSVLSVVSAMADASVPYLAGKIIDSIKTQTVFYFIAVWILVRISGDLVTWRFFLRGNRWGGGWECAYRKTGYGNFRDPQLS